MEIRDHHRANDGNRSALREAYAETKAVYESLYGTADPTIWPIDEITCGDYSALFPAEKAAK